MTAQPVRFETLIERYHDEIYRYLWRMLGPATATDRTDRAIEAQDLTQEVFVRAYRAFGRLRRDSHHRAWLYKIATNCAYTALKRGRRHAAANVPLEDQAHLLTGGADASPDRQLLLTETSARLRGAILALPPQQQAAVIMRHLQDLPYAEIAQALDCSQDSARANVYQGLRRLRQVLGDQYDTESGA
jgi:RNA polymerase sigma-70 factor (ECF subfamily)